MRRLLLLTSAVLLAASALPAAAQELVEPARRFEPKVHTALAVGDPAPKLSIAKWLKGEPLHTFEKGNVYVIEFWSINSAKSVDAIPHLTDLQKTYKDKNLTIVGIAVRDRMSSPSNVEELVTKKGDKIAYTVAWDKDNTTARAYLVPTGVNVPPSVFVVDQQGQIAYGGNRPSALDFVLEKVVAGNWDAKTDGQTVAQMVAQLDSVDAKAGEAPKEAAATLKELDAKYPYLTREMDSTRLKIALGLKDVPLATKLVDKFIDRLIEEKDPEELNQIAWTMVDPEGNPPFKDADLAMKAAKKGVEFSDEKNPAILDTLARCYFVKGDRQNAIIWQKKAVAEAAGNEDLKEELSRTLRDYEMGSN